jgi:hypothetical protein
MSHAVSFTYDVQAGDTFQGIAVDTNVSGTDIDCINTHLSQIEDKNATLTVKNKYANLTWKTTAPCPLDNVIPMLAGIIKVLGKTPTTPKTLEATTKLHTELVAAEAMGVFVDFNVNITTRPGSTYDMSPGQSDDDGGGAAVAFTDHGVAAGM